MGRMGAIGLRSKPPQQRLRHLRDARLVIEECVRDERVHVHGRTEQTLQQRLQFIVAHVGWAALAKLGLV